METRSQAAQKQTDDLIPHQRKVKLIAKEIKRKGEEKQENTPGREISTNSFRLGETPRPNSVHTVGGNCSHTNNYTDTKPTIYKYITSFSSY